ncbi:DUF202 domain-containing protein [Kribbella sp. NPDC051620]|uniref:DUF202 domain-containing protein n=1 Tax=Kribbella sp. NPDC051620 TaxID=3364120 RepID=UPI0037A02612
MREQLESFLIDADVDAVWLRVRDLATWATCVPGLQSSEVLDDETSHWAFAMRLGAVTRMVRLKITLVERVRSKRIAIAFADETGPISGVMSYDLEPVPNRQATIGRIRLSVRGNGPVASAAVRIWRPALSSLARSFAASLSGEAENSTPALAGVSRGPQREARFPGRVYRVGSEPDPRFSLANERTFLAWIRTSLALLAAGVALEVVSLPMLPALRWTASILMVAVGVIISLLAWGSWGRAERALRLGEPLPSPRLGVVLAAGVGTAGMLVLLALLLGP